MPLYETIYRLFSRPIRRMFRVQVTGGEKLPQGQGCILCANHTGLLDVLVISAGLNRQVRYMAKKELFKVPILGPLITALGAYPVNRGGADLTSIRKTLELLGEGELVGVFPQGTRCPGVNPRTCEVKHGVGLLAFRAKCGAVPVYVKTKKNKVRFFGKTELIVGDPISYENLHFTDGGLAEYSAAAEQIFDEICNLGGWPPLTDRATAESAER